MKKIIALSLLALSFSVKAQTLKDKFNKAKEEVKNEVKEVKEDITGKPSLSNDEVIQGLREALNVGTNNSTASASKADGYLKNARLFIPFPPEAQDMKTKLVKLGMQKKVNEFETSLNRAAEEAAKSAAPVFLEAIRNMSIGDGMTILKGADTAATHYLKTNTNAQLDTKFRPIIKDAIEKVKVTSYWTPLVTKYNKIPGVKKQNPDLEAYVTQRAIAGLFVLVADEEAKIRKDPAARVNDILKKVFGYNDTQKK